MRTYAVVALAALGLLAPRPASAQSGAGEYLPDYARAALSGATLNADKDGAIQQTDCSSCGTLKPPALGITGCSSCGNGGMCGDSCMSGSCKPGRTCRHNGTCGTGFFDSFCSGLGECLCCPDPCYEPVWVHAANAALFQDTVRPHTYTRFRFDGIDNMSTPRIAEYFLASRFRRTTSLDVRELTMYQEVGTGTAAFFIEMPYRSINYTPADPTDTANHNAGFVDLNLGTKSMLLDCELLQLAFQFRTYIPTGSSTNGLGTGHVSLEPALLASLKLADRSYLQSQLAYWIPIGGDQDAQGAIVHYHMSFNHLCVERCNWQMIGTLEFNGWSFSDGLAIPDAAPPVRAGGKTYLNAGPGLRFVYCDKYDLGVGYTHALTEEYLGQQQLRVELRIHF